MLLSVGEAWVLHGRAVRCPDEWQTFFGSFFQKRTSFFPLPSGVQTPDPAPHLDEPERGPHRRCIVTREIGERARMLRFVVGPDRQIVPDLAARLPGRGMWLSARADVVETARARGAFARVARGPVTCPADLAAILQAGLRRRVIEHLGLARRAGQAVSGFARAREWVSRGHAVGVVQADDGSVEERARLLSGARSVWAAWPLSADALGAIFGRDHAVHVAIAPGRLADALLNEIERLAGLSGRVLVKQYDGQAGG